MKSESGIMYHTALVTGAARGIGKEIALRFAKNGMNVAVCDRSEEVFKTKEEIEQYGVKCHAQIVDVANEEEIDDFLNNIKTTLGNVDVLVNNAGIGRLSKVIDVSLDEWDRTFAINIRAPFIFAKSILPDMIGQKSGLIVNIASIWGLRGARGRTIYASTKHALVGLSKCLADEYKKDGIRVIALCPGNVKTDLANKYMANSDDWMEPTDVANVVEFLTEERGKSFVGTVIEVDGWGSPPEFE